ncbi:formyltransferase family protein [soil metagenome]
MYALNTVAMGNDTIDFVSRKVKINGIIGLSDRKISDSISDFLFQKEFCEGKNINFTEVTDYSLKNEEDKKKITSLEIDVLIVTGWQRLIPKWLIDHCRICVIGSHGSPFGITGGRGRSPQNWALMLGSKNFSISIFKIDPGIDSGAVIDSREFELSQFDTIKTSYYKVSMLTSEMISDAILSGDLNEKKFEEQDNSEAFYLPQRKPEDGEIDWNRTSSDVNNFVRALTKPYPGAFTYINDQKITVWEGIPFQPLEDFYNNIVPGSIVKIFNKNDLLIKTSDSFFLISEYTSDIIPEENLVFKSVDFKEQMSNIIKRHEAKYPDLKIAPAILKAASAN